MPIVALDGIELAYDVVGEAGQPWVLTPGGRCTKEVGGLPEMARALVDTGRRVVLWDRPNCGASSVVFRGRSESEVQAEALGALLRHLDLGPTVIAGGSGGARVSLLTAARNPDVTAGLAMWWISGGVPGLLQLATYYCMPSSDAAWHGGMEAVAALDQWQETQASNSGNTGRILAVGREEFLAVMDRWALAYCPCDDCPRARPRRCRRRAPARCRSSCSAAARRTCRTPARRPSRWPRGCRAPSWSSRRGATTSGTSAAPRSPRRVRSSCAGRCSCPSSSSGPTARSAAPEGRRP